MNKFIKPKNLKIPISLGVICEKTLFLSGFMGVDEDTREVIQPFSKQTEQVLNRIKNFLEKNNYTLEEVVKVTVFLTDRKFVSDFNTIYKKFFKSNYPARSLVIVKDLAIDAQVEVELIAIKINRKKINGR